MKTKIDANELNLLTLAKKYSNETKARKLFESWRWPGGKPICPHCKHDESYTIKSKPGTKNKARPGLYCCSACRKTFTATVGTPLEDSHLPISKWLMAFFLISSSKKSMSAHQVHRMLNITYKAAWFMCHRIRFAFGDDGEKLKGIVEADETFVGGKGNNSTKYIRKTAVVALVERGGKAKTRIVASVCQKNLGQCLFECVDKSATVNTDEHPGYNNPGNPPKKFPGPERATESSRRAFHQIVNMLESRHEH
jgi:transposase-like protein